MLNALDYLCSDLKSSIPITASGRKHEFSEFPRLLFVGSLALAIEDGLWYCDFAHLANMRVEHLQVLGSLPSCSSQNGVLPSQTKTSLEHRLLSSSSPKMANIFLLSPESDRRPRSLKISSESYFI